MVNEFDMRKHRFLYGKYLAVVIVILGILLSAACKSSDKGPETSSDTSVSAMSTATESAGGETDGSTTASAAAVSSETEDIEPGSSETDGSESDTSDTELSETEDSSDGVGSSDTESTAVPSETTGFEVRFLDVGQGDAALVCCDGHYMLIDGGPSESSDRIYAYLKNAGIAHLDYVVATHPDEDHIGGLSGALEYASADCVLCPVREDDSYSFKSLADRIQRQQARLEVPDAGMEFELGSAHCVVVGPIEDAGKTNNCSIVLHISYGSTSFLFTGDAEETEEESILHSGQLFKADVLKVSHHGSEYSTTSSFLEAVKPSIAIISCGEGNDFGFPTQPVLDRLKDLGVDLYRTDLHGDIVVRSDGETITVETQKTSDADVFASPVLEPAEPDDGLEHDYVINVKSKKFHKPDCDAVSKMDEKNKKEYHGTRSSLIEDGYAPCKMCDP